MKIVILGGTGQIGSVVTRKILADFPEAEVLSCSRKGGKLEHEIQFNVYEKDWSLFQNTDVIINCIGIIEEKGENTFYKAHVSLVEKILSEMENMGNPKLIHISVLGSDKKSKSKYASTKGIADEIIMKQSNWNIIRPSFVCTPGTTIVQKVKMLNRMSKFQFRFLPMPAHFLPPKFQPVMGEDVSDACAQIIKQDLNQKMIYATGPEVYVLKDWIDMISKGKIKIIKIPKWVIDRPFRFFLKLFPQIMSTDQYLLLGEDNTHDNESLKSVINRDPESTKMFWERELVE